MNVLLTVADMMDSNGPGVYSARSGPEKAVGIWNPNHCPIIEAEYVRRGNNYLGEVRRRDVDCQITVGIVL